jgi:hypothetical protein
MRVKDFYSFMTKRERIRLARAVGKPWPWTKDPILQEYKFTNVKRLHDRTTQRYKEWYDEHADSIPEVMLLNCGIARYFGRADFVIGSLGWQHEFKPEYIKNVAKLHLRSGFPVFTGAYLVTNRGIKAPKEELIVDTSLAGLWEMAEDICDVAWTSRSWQAMVETIRHIPGFGGMGFMAKEVVLDTMLTGLWKEPPKDLNIWCPCGPGARRGLNRLNGRPTKASLREAQALEEMLLIFERRASLWPSDWVELELHDIQFQLCEFDKYERTRLGEGRPRAKYRRPA